VSGQAARRLPGDELVPVVRLAHVMFEAERFQEHGRAGQRRVEDGAMGTRSSQISTWTVSSGCSSTWKRSRLPNGTGRCPHTSIASRVAASPGVNWRSS
jgi:hypothetical protein